MFVRNAWYVAGWDHEVGRTMRRRLILNEPVVLFRREDGVPVALEDRCAHRQAPLSAGKLIGNIVECPYHGLQYDHTGACTRVPSQDRVPASCRVKTYPVVERNRWIWIWMGDPAKANPDLIEDFHWIDDPDWRYGGSSMHVEAHYLLLVENLLDTTHLAFLHPTSLGTDDFARSEMVVTREGDRINVNRWLMDRPPAPFHKKMGSFPDGMHVDRWQLATYGPPSFVKLNIGSAPTGTGAREGNRSQGIDMWNLNAITPETDKTTHYFWAQAYNFRLDQRWFSDLVRQQINGAFTEDLGMIKSQQQNMDLGPSPAVTLGQDKGWIAMRQIVARLIAEEQAAKSPVVASERGAVAV
ncbi:MAG: aromatic ring-hydroxylating dioxygenase subunit alpha [Betaproteobacteria bacterium]|nr:aromatic ring-hydroxylating dioxygenase subunit alpha [Betaproteobacteria bacterium]